MKRSQIFIAPSVKVKHTVISAENSADRYVSNKLKATKQRHDDAMMARELAEIEGMFL